VQATWPDRGQLDLTRQLAAHVERRLNAMASTA